MYFYVRFFFFSSGRRHTSLVGDWSSDVCSSDLVGVARAVHERIAGFDALALLRVDVYAPRDLVLALLGVVAHDIDFAGTLGYFAVLHGAVDLGDHCRLA